MAHDHTADGARRILLLGTHGQSNIGDELLLETFLAQLGPRHRYVVNSYSPPTTERSLADRYDVEVIDTARTRLGLLGHIAASDVVVFGGGSIVKELYPSVGRWRHATLVMVLGVVCAARLLRRPVLMCGIGVGPIDTRLGRLLAGLVLRSVTSVSVRDARSLTTCRALGLGEDRLTRIPDVVFVNDPEFFGVASTATTRSGSRARIALNLNRDIANGERWDEALAEIATALDLVAERVPIEVHALPMQSAFKREDDLTVLREFLRDRSRWHPVIHETLDHDDVAEVIAASDVVVSERFHAIVLAAILGRPVVGLAYDVKVEELVADLGVAERSVDINASFAPERLADAILASLDDGEAEGRRLLQAAGRARAQLVDWFAGVRCEIEPTGAAPVPSDGVVSLAGRQG